VLLIASRRCLPTRVYRHPLARAALHSAGEVAEARDRSRGAIDLPNEYAECYAFLQSSIYGAPGKFYDQSSVTPFGDRWQISILWFRRPQACALGKFQLGAAGSGRGLETVKARVFGLLSRRSRTVGLALVPLRSVRHA
jgi:hypothetical protein